MAASEPGKLTALRDYPQLKRMERWVLSVVERVNLSPFGKRAAREFQLQFGTRWVYPSIKNLLHIEGLDRMRALKPPGPTLLVANHRSFFDQYVIACILLRETKVFKQIYSPVRANFFYDSPAGLAVNAIMSGLAMYPPFFREPERAELNRASMELLVRLLDNPETTIGFHPEGTRGKGPDPYQLLPAQPGVGRLVLEGPPDLMVIPVFINGLINDIVKQISSNLDRSGIAITLTFGEPIDLSRFKGVKSRLTTQKKVADQLHLSIQELGERDRAMRARLKSQGVRVD